VPFVRCARNEATYGASVVTPRRKFGGVRTVKPWPCSSVETAFQPARRVPEPVARFSRFQSRAALPLNARG
jgi:hypothetical protein